MTNAETLLDVLNDIDNEHLEEINKRISYVKKRRVVSFTSIAAVFMILCISVIPLLKFIPKASEQELQGSNLQNQTEDPTNITFGCKSEQTADYFYYIDSDGRIVCLDTQTNQTTILLTDNNYTNYDIYADDEHLYLSKFSVGASDTKTNTAYVCYKIIKDTSGNPCGLKLIDNNIVE